MPATNDYQRIETIIRYLDAHHTDQPALDELAGLVGLSSSHFHRLFSSWAGVTPKDFLQCLTFADVRRRLKNGESVLQAALDAGLSGPGRLHDLCVTLEAASPGELKSGGAGWTIVAGFTATPFGQALLAEGRRGICELAFVDDGGETRAWKKLQKDWPKAEIARNDAAATGTAEKLFLKAPGAANLRAFVRGTDFQVRVWRALLQVPSNTVVTYGRLAAAIGQPRAARAVGSAVGQNSTGFLIPCHRVIRETGVVGDYRWGTTRKRAMLAWEACRISKSNRWGTKRRKTRRGISR